jgi:serine/threonine protein kinase
MSPRLRDRLVQMATDAALGMNWLHEMRPERVLHRDLKSNNLLVDNAYRLKARSRTRACVVG